MLKFENETVVLGGLVRDDRLPDMELTGCTVTWGDHPPACVGTLNLNDLTINDTRWWPVLRVERRWLFFLQYTAEMWMGRNDLVVFKDCTFSGDTSEAVEISSG